MLFLALTLSEISAHVAKAQGTVSFQPHGLNHDETQRHDPRPCPIAG
jgi:hypothetical protein